MKNFESEKEPDLFKHKTYKLIKDFNNGVVHTSESGVSFVNKEREDKSRDKALQIRDILLDGSCNVYDILDILDTVNMWIKDAQNKSNLFY